MISKGWRPAAVGGFGLAVLNWIFGELAVAQTVPAAARPDTSERPASPPKLLGLGFRFTGNTVFTSAELSGVVSNWTNRALTSGDLEDARRALTVHYVNRGFLNSGAVLEDQSVTNGVINFRLVEGRLEEVRVLPPGNWLRANYVRDRILLGAGPPLNLTHLEQQLLLLRDNPNVARVNAELEPGSAPGKSLLDVRVTERSPWRAALEVRNDRPPSVGGEILEAQVSHQNVTGHSDPLEFRTGLLVREGNSAGFSGADNLGVSYRVPLTARDTTLQFSYSRNNFAVGEAAFLPLDIKSESDSYGLALRHPFLHTPNREFAVSLVAERKHSESFLLGQPFSFSPGTVNGAATVSVLRLVQEYVHRSPRDVLSLRSSLNVGLDTLGATVNGTPRDGRFVSWIGQAQYVRRLGETANQLILSTSFQWSDSPLLSLEQFSLGGASTVRGYRENQLVRDMGLLGSAELRIPVICNRAGAGVLQLAPFFDLGTGWNVRSATPAPGEIASAGIGLLFTPGEKFSAQLYWGHAFRELNRGQYDAQDAGLHFKVRVVAF